MWFVDNTAEEFFNRDSTLCITSCVMLNTTCTFTHTHTLSLVGSDCV